MKERDSASFIAEKREIYFHNLPAPDPKNVYTSFEQLKQRAISLKLGHGWRVVPHVEGITIEKMVPEYYIPMYKIIVDKELRFSLFIMLGVYLSYIPYMKALVELSIILQFLIWYQR